MFIKAIISTAIAAVATASAAENLIPSNKRSAVVEFKGEGQISSVYIPVFFPEGTEALAFTCEVKYDGVVQGAQNWYNARIMSDYIDRNYKKVKGGPTIGGWTGTHDWMSVRKVFEVPTGVPGIALMPALFNVKAGTLELRNMSLEPISAIDAALDGVKRSETLSVKPEWSTRQIKVSGNRLTDAETGDEIWLQGVAVPSLEWGPGGENILKSVTNLVAQWNVNVIRLAVHSSYWFGRGKGQNATTGLDKYRALVDEVADYMQKRGKYMVLDLHEYRAPTATHAAFWLDAATRYKNHPGVIFGLLNEPHDITWELWRNGGVTSEESSGSAPAENDEELVGEMSVGMQGLVDIVRSTEARNLLSASGLDWGYLLDGVLNGYALNDSNVMYESHCYPWKNEWWRSFISVSEKYPVLMGEVGASDTPMSFETASSFVAPERWVPNMLAAIQRYRLNWTAWSFHPTSSPSLIKNWDYEPTSYWGEYAMRALHGESFELVEYTWFSSDGSGYAPVEFDEGAVRLEGKTYHLSAQVGLSQKKIASSFTLACGARKGALDRIVVTGGSGYASAQLAIGSLLREQNAVLDIHASLDVLGTAAPATVGHVNITCASGADAIGAGAAGSTSISVVPWARGAVSAKEGDAAWTQLVAYDADNGFRFLDDAEYETVSSAQTGVVPTSGANVRVTAAGVVDFAGDSNVNSFSMLSSPSSASTVYVTNGTMHISSGVLDLSVWNSVTVNGNFDFGSATAYITQCANKTATLDGSIAGRDIVFADNAIDCTAANAPLSVKSNGTFTGDLYVNGMASIDTASFLPSGSRKGNVYANGKFMPSGGIMNGLFGSGIVDKRYSGTATLSIGDNDAYGDFEGIVTNSIGNLNITKIGAGEQCFGGSVTIGGDFKVNCGRILLTGTLAAKSVSVANGASLAIDFPERETAGSRLFVKSTTSLESVAFTRGDNVEYVELRENGTELWAKPRAPGFVIAIASN